MALLDFLAGVAGAVPGVADGIERREAEERRRQDIENERKRQEALALQNYERQQRDRMAAIEAEHRLRQEDKAAELKARDAEKARLRQESAQGALGMAASEYGMTADQLRAAAERGQLEPTPGPWAEGLLAEKDPKRAQRVFAAAHRAVTMSQAGVSGDKIAADLKDRRTAEEFDDLTPAQQKQRLERDQMLKGQTPESMKQDNSLARIEARGEIQRTLAEMRIDAIRDRAGAGSGVRSRDVVDSYQDIFKKASDDAKAALAAIPKALLPEQKADAQRAYEAAVAEKAQARKDLDYVLEHGKPPPGPGASATPAAAPAPAAAKPKQVDMAKANEIKQAYQAGRLTRAEAEAQLKALGFK